MELMISISGRWLGKLNQNNLVISCPVLVGDNAFAHVEKTIKLGIQNPPIETYLSAEN
jgi:hypothetical protein